MNPTQPRAVEVIGEVLGVMKDLAHEITMIVVSHEIGFVRPVANRIIFIDESHIVKETTPESLFNHPREARTRAFLSKMLH